MKRHVKRASGAGSKEVTMAGVTAKGRTRGQVRTAAAASLTPPKKSVSADDGKLISVPKVYCLRTFAQKLRTFGLRTQAVQNHIGTTTIRPRGAALQGTPPLLKDPDLSYNGHDTAGKGGVICDDHEASGALLRHGLHGVRIGGFAAVGSAWFGVLNRRDEHASPGCELHVDGDGARARHGKRGGQPLTARGGTAASCLQWGGCVRALANREYPEVNHPEVTREKGGKSVTESPPAVRIHIWI